MIIMVLLMVNKSYHKIDFVMMDDHGRMQLVELKSKVEHFLNICYTYGLSLRECTQFKTFLLKYILLN